jgi:hypothetical protein
MEWNNDRFDLSDRLIHFFREVDLEGDRPLPYVDGFGLNNIASGTVWPALFLLRCAVRSHRLWATWAVRSGSRGVFGRRPAICFSEMPLAVFLAASAVREGRREAMSSYELTFPKAAMFEIGASPVIYGLTDRGIQIPQNSEGGPRVFGELVMPLDEQYRYVTYSPVGRKRVDWLHEREWRWPYVGDLSKYQAELEEIGHVSDASNMPSFDFSLASLKGISIIVKSKDDAGKLAHDVLPLVDQGRIWPGHFDHIVVTEELPPVAELVDPKQTRAAISSSVIDFRSFIRADKVGADAVDRRFSEIVASVEAAAGKSEGRLEGQCWLWFEDNTHPFVRGLVGAGRVKVNIHWQYLADLRELDRSRGRIERENSATKIAKIIKAREEMARRYLSVLDDDPDSPSSSYDPLNSDIYFNRTGFD